MASSSSACPECRILRQRIQELEFELKAVRWQLANSMARQGHGTSQQIVEPPKLQDLLWNLEQYQHQQWVCFQRHSGQHNYHLHEAPQHHQHNSQQQQQQLARRGRPPKQQPVRRGSYGAGPSSGQVTTSLSLALGGLRYDSNVIQFQQQSQQNQP